MPKHPLSEIIGELQREVKMREQVYDRQVAEGRMRPDQRTKKIELIEDAIEYLRDAEDKNGLFGGDA